MSIIWRKFENVSFDVGHPIKNKITIQNYLASSKRATIFTWGNFENLHSPEDFNFEYLDETESYYSCSFSLNGEMFIAGGVKTKFQLSKVTDCKLSHFVQD